jgi:hypothetical protein
MYTDDDDNAGESTTDTTGIEIIVWVSILDDLSDWTTGSAKRQRGASPRRTPRLNTLGRSTVNVSDTVVVLHDGEVGIVTAIEGNVVRVNLPDYPDGLLYLRDQLAAIWTTGSAKRQRGASPRRTPRLNTLGSNAMLRLYVAVRVPDGRIGITTGMVGTRYIVTFDDDTTAVYPETWLVRVF